MSNTSLKMPLGWQILHSLWLIFVFVPLGLLAYVGFFIIGLAARKRKWLITGFIYLVIIMGAFVTTGSYDKNHPMSDIGVFTLLISWIVCIVHSFAARGEYLRIMYKRKLLYEQDLKNALHHQALNGREVEGKQINHRQSLINKKSSAEKVQTTLSAQVINVNKATEVEISALPSIHSFLAKDILNARKRVGRFKSIEHLATTVNIKPHVLKKSEPYIMFTDDEGSLEKEQVDTESKQTRKAGRMVDY